MRHNYLTRLNTHFLYLFIGIWSSILQFSSVAQLCPTLSNPMDCSMPGLPVHHQLLKLTQTHVLWVSDAIQLSHLLSSLSPPVFNLSQHQGLSQRVGSSHQVAKCWSFSFSICPSNEYSRSISLRMDWLDLLAVQGTLKSLPQLHSSKASILQLVPCKTTGRTGGKIEKEVQVILAASSVHSVASQPLSPTNTEFPPAMAFFNGVLFPSFLPNYHFPSLRSEQSPGSRP